MSVVESRGQNCFDFVAALNLSSVVEATGYSQCHGHEFFRWVNGVKNVLYDSASVKLQDQFMISNARAPESML